MASFLQNGVLGITKSFRLTYSSPAERSLCVDAKLDRRRLVAPWRQILTSPPVWGIVLGHTASNWGNYTLMTNVKRIGI